MKKTFDLSIPLVTIYECIACVLKEDILMKRGVSQRIHVRKMLEITRRDSIKLE